MKTIVIMRHAKSSWDDTTLRDYDRPLNARGEADAPKMGKRIKGHGIIPDQIICSAAKRTRKTAKAVAIALDYPKADILKEKELYGAHDQRILDRIKMIPDSVETAIYIGHNPGITEIVNLLGNATIDNMPTAAIACYRFDVSHWADVRPNTGRLQFLEIPSKIEE